MHIFCNPDFKAVFAKRPLKKGEKKYLYRISIENIKETIFDFSNKELLAKSVFAKSGGLFRKSYSF